MVERHWDGGVACCHPGNKVSLGLLEGLNNKIRIIQCNAYGYRDEAYLKLKIIASFLPALPEVARMHPRWSAKMRIIYCAFKMHYTSCLVVMSIL
ncbi:MAG: transposase [Rhodanobacteraceae bacterium]|nr:transposase [Rhodanobacteraceae bacterium]